MHNRVWNGLWLPCERVRIWASSVDEVTAMYVYMTVPRLQGLCLLYVSKHLAAYMPTNWVAGGKTLLTNHDATGWLSCPWVLWLTTAKCSPNVNTPTQSIIHWSTVHNLNSSKYSTLHCCIVQTKPVAWENPNKQLENKCTNVPLLLSTRMAESQAMHARHATKIVARTQQLHLIMSPFHIIKHSIMDMPQPTLYTVISPPLSLH